MTQVQFHPLIEQWFSRKFGEPTPIQRQSWPRIAAGESLVLTAPTGTGKTLAAFLAFINQFATNKLDAGTIRILYVSPLKALNNDVQRNLLEPLAELAVVFSAHNEVFPKVQVLTRSGDTSPTDRQRMLRHPPEILVTTPESLMFMLTASRSKRLFHSISAVVLDEVHSLVENRRGAMAMACLERIVDQSGEFQRIALSATVRPLTVVADYVGGFDRRGIKRAVDVIDASTSKKKELSVHLPDKAIDAIEKGQPIWPHLIDKFSLFIQGNRSTLLFTDSRNMAERVAHDLNESEDSLSVYAHHGSLSREIREEVESQLKSGSLQAIAATSSLEMGIDIGALDEVILIQTPPSVASALQRIGRSGHRVDEVSRARLFPTHGRDIVDAAALAEAIVQLDIKPLEPLRGPLDLLAQLIVSHAVAESCNIDDVYKTLTRSYPYAELSQDQFELVVGMLSGKFEDARIRSLRPRIALNTSTRQITARKGTAMSLYSSGGTIPDRGYYQMRHVDSGALIGELDEEYVWEAKIGQSMTFGSQQWSITSISHNEVRVRPTKRSEASVPFFRSEYSNRDFHFANLVGEFLNFADELLDQNDQETLKNSLAERGFETTAAQHLIELLQRQRQSTGVLPHSGNLLVEHLTTGPGTYVSGASDTQLLLHTSWGGRVNRPIALALQTAWNEAYKSDPDIFCDNYVIAVQLKQGATIEHIIDSLDPTKLHDRLSRSLEQSGFFGARFRECAGRALLLNKSSFNRRVPLWMTRMQSKNLLAAAQGYPDFPILLETWRTCLNDEFDLENTINVLRKLSEGIIKTVIVHNRFPSPFASNITYDQVGRYMYADDAPDSQRTSGVAADLIAQAVRSSQLRPELRWSVIEEFEAKIQRRFPGYLPDDPIELEELVKARTWIPLDQWFEDGLLPANVQHVTQGAWSGLIHAENTSTIEKNTIQAVANTLQFYGPFTLENVSALMPLSSSELESLLKRLVDMETLVDDVRIAGEEGLFLCDRENLEILLRFQRASARPSFQPVSIRNWINYLSAWHQIDRHQTEPDDVLDTVDRMRGYVAPLRFWLRDFWLPRFNEFPRAQIEECLTSRDMQWQGGSTGRIAFGRDEDLAFIDSLDSDSGLVSQCFVDPNGQYTFTQLHAQSSLPSDVFNKHFWDAVWSGRLTSDSLTPLRAGLQHKFELQPQLNYASRRFSRIDRRTRTRSMRNWPGNWRLMQPNKKNGELNSLELFEVNKERVRVLLDRYGIVTREIANRDGGVFRWGEIFNALRAMELSGEIVSGLFIAEMTGPQFARLDALEFLTSSSPSEKANWISAYDPLSPSGFGLDWPEIPARRNGNFLGLSFGKVLCTCTAHGRKLFVHTETNEKNLLDLFGMLPGAITDDSTLAIEEINSSPVRSSPFVQLIIDSTSAYLDHSRLYIEQSLS